MAFESRTIQVNQSNSVPIRRNINVNVTIWLLFATDAINVKKYGQREKIYNHIFELFTLAEGLSAIIVTKVRAIPDISAAKLRFYWRIIILGFKAKQKLEIHMLGVHIHVKMSHRCGICKKRLVFYAFRAAAIILMIIFQ